MISTAAVNYVLQYI